MNDLQVFKFKSNEVRSLLINDEAWFVGKDVAEVLGYQNTRDALQRHVDNEDKADVVIHDGSQNRTLIRINESGLYSLILSSKLPQAKEFKRWVTSEVLPQIRRTGSYANPRVINQSFNYNQYNDALKYIAEILPNVPNKIDTLNSLLKPYSVVLDESSVVIPQLEETPLNAERNSVKGFIDTYGLNFITTKPTFIIYNYYVKWCNDNFIKPRKRNSFSYYLGKFYDIDSHVLTYNGTNTRFYKILGDN